MLDKTGFDLWADDYDKAVGSSDEEKTYPFAGYKDVLGCIFQTIVEKQNATVLESNTQSLIQFSDSLVA